MSIYLFQLSSFFFSSAGEHGHVLDKEAGHESNYHIVFMVILFQHFTFVHMFRHSWHSINLSIHSFI